MATTRLDSTTAECLVFTRKEGMLAAAGHDLKLRVGHFEIEADPAAVRARFDAASLRVVCAVREGRDDPAALSERDRREIEQTVQAKVLDARAHPWISFVAGPPSDGPGGLLLQGALSIRGHERTLSVPLRREGDRAVVQLRLHQPDFGIRPYSALFGALKVQPDVEVRLTFPWPST